jgi:hypothetical protein
MGDVIEYYYEPNDGLYHLFPDYVDSCVVVGIPESFPKDRLEVMTARALAHGYSLVERSH